MRDLGEVSWQGVAYVRTPYTPQFGQRKEYKLNRFYCPPINAVLVAAGISRGMGVTHHDVVDFKNRMLGKNQQPPEPINVDGDTNNNEPKALPSDL